MNEIYELLSLQKEVQHLTWFVRKDDRQDKVSFELSTVGMERKFVCKEADGVALLIDVLFKLKELEKWKLRTLDSPSKKRF